MSVTDLTEGYEVSESFQEPVIDIIFVHGLYETGLKAWRDGKTNTIWMLDLFPHQKYRARILSYVYDAESLMAPGGPAATGIYDESVRLVMELVAERQLKNATRRPIIFICHGFGGLLVKRALAFSNSRNDENHKSIFQSTYALLFMATPHLGVTKESLLFAQPGRHNGPSQFMLGLLDGSETLEEITDQFAPLMRNFSVYNFWEQLETNFGRTKALIVEKTSAAPLTWGDVGKCGVYATHSGIVKFSNTDSPGYRLVLAALDQNISDAVDAIHKRWQNEAEHLQQDRRHELPSVQMDPQRDVNIYPKPTSFVASVRSLNQTQKSHFDTHSNPCKSPIANSHYIVPYRSEYFVGRQKQADLLRIRFGTDEVTQPKICVIYGLPGSGKTQFCLKYSEDNRQRYWGVFWIDCSSEVNADNSFAVLSHRAGKGGEPGGGLEWLSQTVKPWLLILDNANDPDMLISKFIPAAGNGHVLVTTRNPSAQFYNNVGSFQFRGMDPEEAITLLLRLAYPEKETPSMSPSYRQPAEVIASELGYLALALKQAAITIRQHFWPLERYLESLLGCRKALLSRPTIQSAADANIIATWELPFNGIVKDTSTRHRDAVDLIHVFAFLHFASIPSSIFSRSSGGIKRSTFLRPRLLPVFEPNSTQVVEDRILTAARVLYDHSIISISELDEMPQGNARSRVSTQCFSLHPAIHRWARERLDETQQRDWLDCAASILAHSISANMETSGRTFRRQLVPHIDFCISLLNDTYPIFPCSLEQAFSLEKFGLVYAENGLWKRARSLQLKVVKFRTEYLGKRHVDTINAQRALANTYWNLFEVEQCLNIQKQILIAQWWSRPSIRFWITWPPWRPVHIPYCMTLDDLTRSLWLAGRREWSRTTGERAVDALTKDLGPDDPLTLNAIFNLARTYLHLGEHSKSYDLLLQVQDKRTHFFGPDHPDTLMVRNEIGMCLCAQRVRLDEAERHVHSVLDSRKRVLGEEHAYTLWSVNDLSKIYCELQRFDDAAHILEEIIPVVKRTLGDTHVGMIMTQSNLCRAYIYCEKWEEAGKMIRHLREIVPQTHPDWIHVNWGYAYVLVHEGMLDEAESCCDMLLSHISGTRVLKPDNPRVAAIAEVLLKIYQLQSREHDSDRLRERFPQLDDKEVMRSIDHMPLGPLRRRMTHS